MTINECIKQLESLRAHCDAMFDDKFANDDPWDKDAQALDMASRALTMGVNALVMGWIECGKRMPDDNERVIAFRPREPKTSAYRYTVMWGWSVKIAYTRRGGVTHWMPLPEPQKEGEENEERGYDMDGLIRRSMLGDKEAAAELTEQGVAIPCPFCGGSAEYFGNSVDNYVSCNDCATVIANDKFDNALYGWNTRMQLVTFCKDCKHYHAGDHIEDNGCRHIFGLPDPVDEYDFCSYGEPRED